MKIVSDAIMVTREENESNKIIIKSNNLVFLKWKIYVMINYLEVLVD